MDKIIRIGGASGFWGDAARATPQLLAAGDLDFIVYDYLAEITMSIMARARAKDAVKGYAADFVNIAMRPNLAEVARQGLRIISNAGGVNPQACAAALREEIVTQGLDLKVACVMGDDLLGERDRLATQDIKEMFSGSDFPNAGRLQSINAYLGAFPIAKALDLGADIVVTGRGVDSAVTLGACIHSFGWGRKELNKLAMGSLAGHILECGPQATGGNFTDWERVADQLDIIGYPIAEVSADGGFICTKPEGSGGIVNVGTIAEQMVYEIGDPQAYLLPDVICDFSEVKITSLGNNRVQVAGAKGRGVPYTYKVCATYADQFRGGLSMSFYGIEADKKAQAMAAAIFRASRREFEQQGLADFAETSVELIGAESQYGEHRRIDGSREVAMKLAVKHPDAAGVGVVFKEAVGLGLATPPGLSGFQGARPKPSPIVRLFSFLLPKDQVPVRLDIDGERVECHEAAFPGIEPIAVKQPALSVGRTADHAAVHAAAPVTALDSSFVSDAAVKVRLVDLAWGRSGDKGNKANIGIIARRPEYLPYICAVLTEQFVSQRFAHFFAEPFISEKEGSRVQRFLLPGIHAINFLLHDVLGGGGIASIRNDAQGKGYAQLLLDAAIPVAPEIAATIQEKQHKKKLHTEKLNLEKHHESV